ncbi:MAG: glutamate-1-semialdehyde 2,1-aminomutase [Thaumarchaeota archaeon]|nr:glutamate-1-semialdehyde 2,1-aminomutase [Nitrososphaerota archaeon]
MNTQESETLFSRALKIMVGGVNSPVRAFKGVGGKPLFIERGMGSRIWDADGNEFTDFTCSWGAILLGHSYPDVIRASYNAMAKGSSFGAPTRTELQLAEEISATVKTAEMVRLVNSGTEAVMTAIRLSRGFTGKKTIVKFEGGYHGHSDTVLSKAGSGLATLGIPSSAGVTEGCVSDTVTLEYNNTGKFESYMDQNGRQVAAVIIEPVAGNMGVIPADRAFLLSLRKKCDENSCILIFDEVISGFRVSREGAQGLYGIYPDLSVFGKVIGGGFPIGATAGKSEVMKRLAPEGPVYQAGTLAGNPVAAAAGLAVLSHLDKSVYQKLEEYGKTIEKLIKSAADKSGIGVTVNRVGSMFSTFFTNEPVKNFNDVLNSRRELYPIFFWSLIRNGIYAPPSPYESHFFTASHAVQDISQLGIALENSFEALKNERRAG